MALTICVGIGVVIFLLLNGLFNKFGPQKKQRPLGEYIHVSGKFLRVKNTFVYGQFIRQLIFQFSTLEGDTIEGMGELPSSNRLISLTEGDKVNIYYNPHNPYDFFVA